jgi:hypothetical protein
MHGNPDTVIMHGKIDKAEVNDNPDSVTIYGNRDRAVVQCSTQQFKYRRHAR